MNKNRWWSFLLAVTLLLAGCANPKTEAASGSERSAEKNSASVVPAEAAPETSLTPETEAASEPLKGESVMELTEEQNGGLAALIVNDILRVTIDGVPSTGFTWEPENLDTTLLEQQGEPTFTATSNLKGSGGNYVFTFKAIKAGVTTLRLIYHRPFEKDTPPERIYEVQIDIQQ
jgi:inhibitor of cysteine peptidase